VSDHYFQPFVVLRNDGGQLSPAFHFPDPPNNSYRGGAAADFDNDGRMDVVVVPISGQPLLLHNTTQNSNNWVGLRVRGTLTNRDAIGASVEIGYCGKTQFDSVRNGGSYLSRNDPRLHFGLGDCGKLDRVAVKWPRSGIQVLNSVPVNRYITIEEPR
jgi:hypothetical protein